MIHRRVRGGRRPSSRCGRRDAGRRLHAELDMCVLRRGAWPRDLAVPSAVGRDTSWESHMRIEWSVSVSVSSASMRRGEVRAMSGLPVAGLHRLAPPMWALRCRPAPGRSPGHAGRARDPALDGQRSSAAPRKDGRRLQGDARRATLAGRRSMHQQRCTLRAATRPVFLRAPAEILPESSSGGVSERIHSQPFWPPCARLCTQGRVWGGTMGWRRPGIRGPRCRVSRAHLVVVGSTLGGASGCALVDASLPQSLCKQSCDQYCETPSLACQRHRGDAGNHKACAHFRRRGGRAS